MATTQTTDDKMTERKDIVQVRNLQTAFFTDKETIRAVDGISFDLTSGKTIGIVGESGSGKSVTARSLMGLVDSPGQVLQGSSIQFHNLETVQTFVDAFSRRTVDITELESEHDAETIFREEVDSSPESLGYESIEEIGLAELAAHDYLDDLGLVDPSDCIFITEGSKENPESGFIELSRVSGKAQRKIRGKQIAMVFQDPLTSLNPVYTVGNQIKEALRLHQGLTGSKADAKAIDLLDSVGIPDARRRLTEYPHQFSGGMRQRAVIAMALACDPKVLIADEPTTALDVTIQAQILNLLKELQESRDLAVMFITHDMGVIAEISDRVNVMYAGEVVESADVETLFEKPRHPYTRGLLNSIPARQSGDRLSTIEGSVPTPNEPAQYCRFAPRCPRAFDECEKVAPVPVDVNEESTDHKAACLLYPEQLSKGAAVKHHQSRQKTRGDAQ